MHVTNDDRQLAPNRKRVLPKGSYKRIEELASQGAREPAIARELGFSASTWTRVKERDPKALAAFQRGRDALEQNLIATLLRPEIPAGHSVQEGIALMRQKCFGALALGNSLFAWSKQPDTSATATLQVQINIPAPLSREAYRARLASPEEDTPDGQN